MSARHFLLPIAALAMMSAIACLEGPNMASTSPLTRAEQSDFQETSRYADVRAFIDALASQTPRVRVEMFGRSEEGRELPLLVIGDPPADRPVGRSGPALPTVFVMANIHAGEVEGKEAVLHLARRLTLGDLQPLLRSAVWLFAPIYNADGNEKVSLENRSEQYGPVGGVGTRENARGLDLNRDFMKLESSEARALVGAFTRWNPDVVVDLHTTNGSYHGYHLTYAPALNPNADPRITAFTRDRLLPAVRRAMTERHEFRTYDYGNFAVAESLEEELEGFGPDDTRKVWRTYDPRPRFGNNYVGLRNRIAILSEAYSYVSFERRVRATEAFVEEIMRFVAAHSADIGSLTTGADAAQSTRHANGEWRRFRAAPAADARRCARRSNRHADEPALRQADEDHDRERGDAHEHDRLRRVRLDGDAANACRVHRPGILEWVARDRGAQAARARNSR